MKELRQDLWDDLGLRLSHSGIYKALKSLGVSKKVRIKSAIEKFTPANQQLDREFQLLRTAIDVRDVVIIDEVSLKDIEVYRKYGWSAGRHIDPDKKSPGPQTMFIVAATWERVLPCTLAVPSTVTVSGEDSTCAVNLHVLLRALVWECGGLSICDMQASTHLWCAY